MSESLLEAEAIEYTPRGLELFGALSLNVGSGEIIEIRGPNGSGKSTLLRIFAGLQRPHLGSVRRKTEAIAYVGHDSGLTGVLSVAENLRWNAAMSGHKITSDDIRRSLSTFDIFKCMHTPIRSLSAGQTRRATLASLLLVNASVWILDEPLASLDTEGAELLANITSSYVDEGGAVIYATHTSLAVEANEVIGLGQQ